MINPPTSDAAIRGASATIARQIEFRPVMTKPQLAEALSCTTKHLDNLTKRGLLPVVRLGRCVRYRRDAVELALAAMENSP